LDLLAKRFWQNLAVLRAPEMSRMEILLPLSIEAIFHQSTFTSSSERKLVRDDRLKELDHVNCKLEERLILRFLRDRRIVKREQLREAGGDPERIAQLDQEIEALEKLRDRHDAGEELPMSEITSGGVLTTIKL
jgi:hypothetical protein